MPGHSASGEDKLLDFQQAASWLSPHLGERQMEREGRMQRGTEGEKERVRENLNSGFFSFSCKDTNSMMGTPPSRPHLT